LTSSSAALGYVETTVSCAGLVREKRSPLTASVSSPPISDRGASASQ